MTAERVTTPIRDSTGPLTLHRPPLAALTGVRFVAAAMVVLYHFGIRFAQRHNAPGALTNFLTNGWTAVTLFFILSGFILTYTYSGHINASGGKKRFWEARFARIYPVYLLSLLLSWPFRGPLGPGLTVAVLAMVQAWNPFHLRYAGAWNSPAWTLSTEAFFYLLFPFLLPILEKCSLRVLRIVAALTLLLITFGHTMTPAVEPLTGLIGLPLPALRLPEFIAGMACGLIFLRGRHSGPSWLVYAAAIAALAILALIKGAWISLLAIPFAILIFQLAAHDSRLARLLGTRTFLLLGGASYAIYLLQEPVRSWIHLAFTGSAVPTDRPAGVDAFLSPIVLILFSILVYLFWEEPSRKWLRFWFKRHNRTARPAA